MSQPLNGARWWPRAALAAHLVVVGVFAAGVLWTAFGPPDSPLRTLWPSTWFVPLLIGTALTGLLALAGATYSLIRFESPAFVPLVLALGVAEFVFVAYTGYVVTDDVHTSCPAPATELWSLQIDVAWAAGEVRCHWYDDDTSVTETTTYPLLDALGGRRR